MEHMKRACHFHLEAKTKCIKSRIVTTKSSLFKSIEPDGYTMSSSLNKYYVSIRLIKP